MKISINKIKASSLQAKSDSILDGFRQALTNYSRVNEQISSLEKEHLQELEKIQKEYNSLVGTRINNEKQIVKIENFLN